MDVSQNQYSPEAGLEESRFITADLALEGYVAIKAKYDGSIGDATHKVFGARVREFRDLLNNLYGYLKEDDNPPGLVDAPAETHIVSGDRVTVTYRMPVYYTEEWSVENVAGGDMISESVVSIEQQIDAIACDWCDIVNNINETVKVDSETNITFADYGNFDIEEIRERTGSQS